MNGIVKGTHVHYFHRTIRSTLASVVISTAVVFGSASSSHADAWGKFTSLAGKVSTIIEIRNKLDDLVEAAIDESFAKHDQTYMKDAEQKTAEKVKQREELRRLMNGDSWMREPGEVPDEKLAGLLESWMDFACKSGEKQASCLLRYAALIDAIIQYETKKLVDLVKKKNPPIPCSTAGCPKIPNDLKSLTERWQAQHIGLQKKLKMAHDWGLVAEWKPYPTAHTHAVKGVFDFGIAKFEPEWKLQLRRSQSGGLLEPSNRFDDYLVK